MRQGLDLLAGADRSRADLERQLSRRHAAPAVKAALDRLEELGLVDDRAFAQRLVERRLAQGGISRRRLAQELARHGVDGPAAAQALAWAAHVEPQSARRFTERVWARGPQGDPNRRALALARRLLAAGYPAALTRQLVLERCPEAADLPWLDQLEDG